MTRRELAEQLAQIQAQHTGKVPFCPLDDLEHLFDSLDLSSRQLLVAELRDRERDSFWSYFVREFFTSRAKDVSKLVQTEAS